MLDRDLAELYEVETKRLNEQVRRNITRFPDDFMFQLTKEEAEGMRFHFGTASEEPGINKPILKSHFATSRSRPLKEKTNLKYQNCTSSLEHGGIRKLPYAFTEQGVAMLSSVLRSEKAILVNIQIMRTFTKIREMLVSNEELQKKIEELEGKYDYQFSEVFKAIHKLIDPPEKPKPKIGFRTDGS